MGDGRGRWRPPPRRQKKSSNEILNRHVRLRLKKYDCFLALGCVIKGETPHFDFISQASTNAIMDLSINNKKPIGNGIITCLNMRQAKARKNKGAEAAKAVISILSQK